MIMITSSLDFKKNPAVNVVVLINRYTPVIFSSSKLREPHKICIYVTNTSLTQVQSHLFLLKKHFIVFFMFRNHNRKNCCFTI